MEEAVARRAQARVRAALVAAARVGIGGGVRIHARRRDADVVFSVTDRGPGIPAEHLGRIFDRFWQAEHAPPEGAGLGLAIARGIVEAHGGRIRAESGSNGGATLSFTLPVYAADSPVGSATATP